MQQNDNILVLIQLVGGNDGLSTLVPLESYANLALHRKNILVPEKELLKAGSIGFHPSVRELFGLYNDDAACIVNNVGYSVPNRSHFRSMDIWNSGSPSDQQWDTGWLGRLLDLYHPNYPGAYPNGLYPDPLAITVGNIVSDTCQGKLGNYSHVVDNLTTFAEISKCSIGTIANKHYSGLLDYLNANITLTNLYTKQLEKAAAKGNSYATYPEKNKLAHELQIVSRLISGGLKTKIYVLSMGGFDTHAYQTGKNNPLEGMHSRLLETLSAAISAFISDLKLLGCYNRVCIMTYSEFGRQIGSNNANGTDHGDATSLFIFGSSLNNRLTGNMPVIPEKIERQQGLEMEIDFRDLFSSVLSQWFAVPMDNMAAIFKTVPKKYSIFKS